jgi:hypothetical protein
VAVADGLATIRQGVMPWKQPLPAHIDAEHSVAFALRTRPYDGAARVHHPDNATAAPIGGSARILFQPLRRRQAAPRSSCGPRRGRRRPSGTPRSRRRPQPRGPGWLRVGPLAPGRSSACGAERGRSAEYGVAAALIWGAPPRVVLQVQD